MKPANETSLEEVGVNRLCMEIKGIVHRSQMLSLFLGLTNDFTSYSNCRKALIAECGVVTRDQLKLAQKVCSLLAKEF